ncbi:MAG: recombinase family protein [Acidimicrobiia bacterium]
MGWSHYRPRKGDHPRTRAKAPVAAAVYCRISLDRQGEGLGVDRQDELCRKLAAARGWQVAETYTDNDISAYSGKRRPAFGRMLADLEAERRDGVVCVDLDRLTRRPIELEQFIDLADRRGIALANVAGDTDLSTSDGRLKARILGSVARQESEKKAERQRRESEHAARRGVPRGSRRPFGYEPDRVTIRETEADLVREAARRVFAGETVAAVCRDWNERGVESPKQGKYGWSPETLVGILRSPRYAGLRDYKGEVVAEGQWEPIIDRSTWETLQMKIRRVARVGRPSTHLLSGIARCGKCGSPLWTSWGRTARRKVPRYACVKRPGAAGCGGITAAAAPLDETVRDAIIDAATGPRFARALEARLARTASRRRRLRNSTKPRRAARRSPPTTHAR